MKVSEYWVDNYHPFEITKTINDLESDSKQAVIQASFVGNCKIKAELIHNQRMVGYFEALNINGCLSPQFKSELKNYKKEYYYLSEKYPEKLI